MVFKIPLDAWVVAVPIGYACLAFTGLIAKTLMTDPEMSTQRFYDQPTENVEKAATEWNDSVACLFKSRIQRHRWGVFNNEVKVE